MAKVLNAARKSSGEKSPLMCAEAKMSRLSSSSTGFSQEPPTLINQFHDDAALGRAFRCRFCHYLRARKCKKHTVLQSILNFVGNSLKTISFQAFINQRF